MRLSSRYRNTRKLYREGLNSALTGGGNVTFNCGLNPVTITVNNQQVISGNTLIDGGNLITLSGGGVNRIFYNNNNIQFTIKNLTIANGSSNEEVVEFITAIAEFNR